MRTKSARVQGQSTITTALIYTRVSSDEQEREGLSLPTQLADCRRYAADRAWAIGTEYQDVLKGTRDDRPQYQNLLAEVRQLHDQGVAVAVVVKWLHRLGRRVLESVRAREELKRLGVAVHSTMEGGLVGDFLANIMASTAQYEVEQLGERVREVNRHITASGWRPVGRCPWGYRWRDATAEDRATGAPKRVLEADAAAAPFVQTVFRRVSEGESVRAVARWAAALPVDIRGGRALSFDAIRRLLSAPVYVGRSEPDERGATHHGRWPALVDTATWERAQVQISGHRKLPHQGTGRHLLTGLMRCPKCGARMGGKTRRNGRSVQYVCIAKMLGANALASSCETTAIAEQVEADVMRDVAALVEALTADELRMRGALHRAWEELRRPAGRENWAAQVRRLQEARERAKRRLAAAAIALVDGSIDKSAYDAARSRIQDDLKSAEDELDRLRSQSASIGEILPEFDEVLRQLTAWADVIASMHALKRQMLAALIDRIEPVRERRGRYAADVDWSAFGKALWKVAARAQSRAA